MTGCLVAPFVLLQMLWGGVKAWWTEKFGD